MPYALNNAGFDEAETTLVEETSEAFDKIMNINVRGVWLCMKYEIPEMLRRGAGDIVNMSSGAGVIGSQLLIIAITLPITDHNILSLQISDRLALQVIVFDFIND